MRIANLEGRAVIVEGDTAIDVAEASEDRFGPDPARVFAEWESFRGWAAAADLVAVGGARIDPSRLDCPSPSPRQIVAVGLNYSEHAAESGFEVPEKLPPTFTKFASSLSGPVTEVQIPAGGNVDWEVELVAVIGKEGFRIPEDRAWEHIAGLTVGQDISERVSQLAGPAPQFSLGKSFPGFAPVGPWVVTPDEFDDPDDLQLGCSIDGETVQSGRTSELIFPLGSLVSKLSQTIRFYPGDLIFSGTPAGVGVGRQPQRFLQPGETLRSWIEGIGELQQRFVAPKN